MSQKTALMCQFWTLLDERYFEQSNPNFNYENLIKMSHGEGGKIKKNFDENSSNSYSETDKEDEGENQLKLFKP